MILNIVLKNRECDSVEFIIIVNENLNQNKIIMIRFIDMVSFVRHADVCVTMKTKTTGWMKSTPDVYGAMKF